MKKYLTLVLAFVMSLMLLPTGVMAVDPPADSHTLNKEAKVDLSGQIQTFPEIYEVKEGKLSLNLAQSHDKLLGLFKTAQGFPKDLGEEGTLDITSLTVSDANAMNFNVKFSDEQEVPDNAFADYFTFKMGDLLKFNGEAVGVKKPVADMTAEEKATAIDAFKAELYKEAVFGTPAAAEGFVQNVALDVENNLVNVTLVDGSVYALALDGAFVETQTIADNYSAWTFTEVDEQFTLSVNDPENLTSTEMKGVAEKVKDFFLSHFDAREQIKNAAFDLASGMVHIVFTDDSLIAVDYHAFVKKAEPVEEMAVTYENYGQPSQKVSVVDSKNLSKNEKIILEATVKEMFEEAFGNADMIDTIKLNAEGTAVDVTFADASVRSIPLDELIVEKEKATVAEETSIAKIEKLVLKTPVSSFADLDAAQLETIKSRLEKAYQVVVGGVTVNYVADQNLMVVVFADGSEHKFGVGDTVTVEKTEAEKYVKAMPEASEKLGVEDIHDITRDEFDELKLLIQKVMQRANGKELAFRVKYTKDEVSGKASVYVIFEDSSNFKYDADNWMFKDETKKPVNKDRLKELLEIVYKRLNDTTKPLSNLEFFNLKIGYDRANEVMKNDRVSQAEVDKTVKELEKLMGLDLVAPINRAELETLIRKAYDILNGKEALPYGLSMETLRAAYDEAYDVFRDNGASQKALDEQCTKLRKAMGMPEPVKKPINRSKLDELITLAYNKLMEGTKEMTIQQYNALKAIYDKAYAVYTDNSATQAQIDEQVKLLAKAMGLSGYVDAPTPTDREALADMINKAYTALNSGTLNTVDYANLKLAYDEAYAAYQNSASTQKDINGHVQKLRHLLGLVEPPTSNVDTPQGGVSAVGVNKNYLKEALDLAYGKLTSTTAPLAKAEYDKIHPAYQKALAVYKNANSTQQQVDEEVTALKLAMGIVDVPRTADFSPIILLTIMAVSSLGGGAIVFNRKKR